jgi:hypothetical protein
VDLDASHVPVPKSCLLFRSFTLVPRCLVYLFALARLFTSNHRADFLKSLPFVLNLSPNILSQRLNVTSQTLSSLCCSSHSFVLFYYSVYLLLLPSPRYLLVFCDALFASSVFSKIRKKEEKLHLLIIFFRIRWYTGGALRVRHCLFFWFLFVCLFVCLFICLFVCLFCSFCVLIFLEVDKS